MYENLLLEIQTINGRKTLQSTKSATNIHAKSFKNVRITFIGYKLWDLVEGGIF